MSDMPPSSPIDATLFHEAVTHGELHLLENAIDFASNVDAIKKWFRDTCERAAEKKNFSLAPKTCGTCGKALKLVVGVNCTTVGTIMGIVRSVAHFLLIFRSLTLAMSVLCRPLQAGHVVLCGQCSESSNGAGRKDPC